MRLDSEQGTHSGKHVRIKADACELTCTNHHPSPGKTHCVATTGFFLSPVCLRSVSIWALNFRGNVSKKYNSGNYSDLHSLKKKLLSCLFVKMKMSCHPLLGIFGTTSFLKASSFCYWQKSYSSRQPHAVPLMTIIYAKHGGSLCILVMLKSFCLTKFL